MVDFHHRHRKRPLENGDRATHHTTWANAKGGPPRLTDKIDLINTLTQSTCDVPRFAQLPPDVSALARVPCFPPVRGAEVSKVGSCCISTESVFSLFPPKHTPLSLSSITNPPKMKFSTPLSALAGVATATATPLDEQPLHTAHLFSNPPPDASSLHRIPTSYESAVQGRRILALSPLATLATVFPTSYASPTEDADGLPQSILMEHRPAGLGGVPIGLMDYIADCDDDDQGNPTILAIKIATSFKNVEAGSNMSISVNWVPPYPPSKRIESSPPSWGISFLQRLKNWRAGRPNTDEDSEQNDKSYPSGYDPVPYSAANLPRFSLLGYLEPIPADASSEKAAALQSCFLKYHPDARYWLPGNRIHESEWVRLVVTQVYWIGGFGDRAYIGWIPVEEWKNVTRKEWEGARLPGEKKGWKEWSVEQAQVDL